MGLFKNVIMDTKKEHGEQKEQKGQTGQTVQAEQYNAKEAEKRLKEFWEKEEIYKFNSKTKKKIFSVDTPPPTVSGKMHIGHAFSYAQQDFIIRFQRMLGKNVFYPL